MNELVPAKWENTLGRLRDDINQTFGRWLSPARWRRDRHEEDEFWTPTLMAGDLPAIDMEEDDDEIRVTAELPGLNKDDFKVELKDNSLTIRGEKQINREEKKRHYYYSECAYGIFTRTLPLPCEVDIDKVDAKFKNGVLKIRLFKTENAKSRLIKVSVS